MPRWCLMWSWWTLRASRADNIWIEQSSLLLGLSQEHIIHVSKPVL